MMIRKSRDQLRRRYIFQYQTLVYTHCSFDCHGYIPSGDYVLSLVRNFTSLTSLTTATTSGLDYERPRIVVEGYSLRLH